MIQFRKEQLAAIEGHEVWLAQRLLPIVQKVHPMVSGRLGASGTERRIITAVRQAKRLSIEAPENRVRFVHLAFALDSDTLDTAPETRWVPEILGWLDADEELKLAALEKRARKEIMRSFR